MGGGDSSDKRDWFAGAIVDLFPVLKDSPPTQNAQPPTAEEPDTEYVETMLLQVMFDEFEVNVDDESAFEVAQEIMQLRRQCVRGEFGGVDILRRRWQAAKGAKVGGLFRRAEDPDQDTEGEGDSGTSDDEDAEDVDMSEAPPPGPVQAERGAPETDEDGFTKVARKKR
jgi:pre-rRNA-processing protein TSR2